MRVLITGRAGSGKTTVCKELRKRGYTAYDSDDIPNLSAWTDEHGNKKKFADNSYVDLNVYDWLWDEAVLRSLLDNHANIFICGGAHNDLAFDNLFDACFVLDVDPKTQIARIISRKDNDYGKDPRMHDWVVANQREHLAQAIKQNHTVVDTTQPIEVVVNSILEQIHDN